MKNFKRILNIWVTGVPLILGGIFLLFLGSSYLALPVVILGYLLVAYLRRKNHKNLMRKCLQGLEAFLGTISIVLYFLLLNTIFFFQPEKDIGYGYPVLSKVSIVFLYAYMVIYTLFNVFVIFRFFKKKSLYDKGNNSEITLERQLSNCARIS
ncbi:hypothetical protein NEFER03_0702 [Nematocida sp. LUAm3]|nr:hypothetical protein NEFER03_0702 [Nematocida sp. LUAm3]KAI5175161.1 hypothetical protein NEFER02_1122 [Nematocida sp. LUAm2]KAI5178167.1 hypothetical protein NEFER01_1345 [Nematocida sp. LUAm1]